MNKQPFYHSGYIDSDKTEATEDQIKTAIIKIPKVLRNTYEFYCDELLFTATSDVSVGATAECRAIGVVFITPIDSEPGDPCDLI